MSKISWYRCVATVVLAAVVAACGSTTPAEKSAVPAWQRENPIKPPAPPPLGMEVFFEDVKPPSPSNVRLGRWLFYDARLSADHTVACASCHKPEFAFSEATPVYGYQGTEGWPQGADLHQQGSHARPGHFLGRPREVARRPGPRSDRQPDRDGQHARRMIATLSRVQGYKPYFKEAFGTDEITKERVAQAIADYERTRVSGNSPYDRWRFNHEQDAVTTAARRGHDSFFDTAGCVQCHTGSSFSDSLFHNTGVGWDPKTKTFKDEGRFAVTKKPEDRGAFKTLVLRDVSKHAPYMHDGSIATLREVVELYNKGGIANPYLTKGRIKPLGLKDEDVDAIVAFLESLDGQGYQDTPPTTFPQ